MVLRKRRWLATAGLMAALSLAVPAPSTAAGLWRSAAELPGLFATAWSWLESLGVVRRMPEPSRRPLASGSSIGAPLFWESVRVS